MLALAALRRPRHAALHFTGRRQTLVLPPQRQAEAETAASLLTYWCHLSPAVPGSCSIHFASEPKHLRGNDWACVLLKVRG